MVNDLAVQNFVNSINEQTAEPSKTYLATVSKIDQEGVIWVNLQGSDKETPTASSSSEVKRGDTINVEWRNNKLYIAGNFSNPSAGIGTVNRVENVANDAQATASIAFTAANNAVADAERAHAAADEAEGHAQTALTNAGLAKSAAESAQTSADSALVSLATVEDVVGVLNWITAHGTMTANGSTALDPAKVYFIRDNNGDYTVGSYNYSIVAEPKAEDRTNYYTLSVDESVQNYVATHVTVNSEGMWLIPDQNGSPTTDGKKILIATGAGTYTAGTHIIDRSSGVDSVLASFRADGATIGKEANTYSRTLISTGGMKVIKRDSLGNDIELANIGYDVGNSETAGVTALAPYYTLGVRYGLDPPLGNYSVAEGNGVTASGYASHAEGDGTFATGNYSHAEGQSSTAQKSCAHAEGLDTVAGNINSHAEGYMSEANGANSHAQNEKTIASKTSQTAIGTYNVADTATTTTHPSGIANYGKYAFIVGNGTASQRSNAMTVDWAGNVTDGNGNTISKSWFYVNTISATTISSVNTYTKVNVSSLGNGSGFAYDSTNKGIKCTKAGIYAISVQIPMDTATSGDLVGLGIYKNGSLTIGPAYMRMGGTYDSAILMPTYVNLAENDYLTFYIRNNTAGRGVTGTGCRITCWEMA